MKATAKNFFGTNLEQEVLDQIIILPHANRDGTGNGTITVPTGVTWADLEFLEIGMGVSSQTFLYESISVDKLKLTAQPTAWRADLNFVDEAGSVWRLAIQANSATTATWVSTSSTSEFCWPQYMVGYKRRISRVGLDELMSSMGLPNLCANADLDNPINQRNFDGNWASLAIGEYGYDQWMKVSSTHMGYVVEAGKYRPNAKHTLTKDDVVIGEFMSPASGHWTVAVPFATSGKFDLYAGQFKRPWHPVQDGDSLCRRYYFKTLVRQSGSMYSSGYVILSTITFPSTMRKIPAVKFLDDTLFPASGWTEMSDRIRALTDGVDRIVRNTTLNTNQVCYVFSTLTADASITLAEVNGQITTIG